VEVISEMEFQSFSRLGSETLMSVRASSVAAFVALLALVGCGGPTAKVTGRVTCQDKPVVGSIVFSPKGEDANNKGPAVPGQLKEDGTYEIRLTTVGKHTVVITPSNINYPPKPGEFDYPCDRTPTEWEVKAGTNKIDIEMTVRKR
jgi:hypothetical protein